MPILTDLAQAEVRRGVRTLFGQVMTRPALLVTDGTNITYACDVNIGPTDPTGRINQYIDEKNHATAITGLPGQQEWNLGDELTINTILRNVTIARGNQELIYADIGSPVTLRRTQNGRWEITGFSQELPGTYTLTPVTIPSILLGPVASTTLVLTAGGVTIGDTEDFSVTTRLLTWGEFGEDGTFGNNPYGASAIFIGGVLSRIV